MISKVGKFVINEAVIYDGVIAKIVKFLSRKKVLLKSLSDDGKWQETEAPVKNIVQPLPMSVVIGDLEDGDEYEHKIALMLAESLSRGMREKGLAAKAVMNEKKNIIFIDVFVMAERPPKQVTLTFSVNK